MQVLNIFSYKMQLISSVCQYVTSLEKQKSIII